MITLQTPGTGFDDFESKIALGLCRIALDCVEPEKVTLEESFDRYLVHIDIENDKMDSLVKSLSWWCLRLLSDEVFLGQKISLRPRWRNQQAEGIADLGISLNNKMGFDQIFQKYLSENQSLRVGSQDSACGHREDGIFGALEEIFSPQLGQPPKRNNIVNQKTLPLCSSCGVLGLLGTASFQLIVSISRRGKIIKEKYFFMPKFRGSIRGDVLLSYIATVKHIRPSLYDIPANSALLALLSMYPHLSRIFISNAPTVFVSRADTSGNVRRYADFEERNIESEMAFLGEKKSGSYNVALAQNTYRHVDDKPELIGLLSRTLQFKQAQDAVSFCREYVSVTEGKQIVYKESVKYIAKEVLGMDEKLIDDPNIGAIASMLRFFVSKQKFGYVDNLRGSRTPEEFEKHLLSAQRDAASIYSKPNDKKDREEKCLFLPNENNIREVLKLLEKNFEQVKTLTCLLSFSYWKKEE